MRDWGVVGGTLRGGVYEKRREEKWKRVQRRRGTTRRRRVWMVGKGEEM